MKRLLHALAALWPGKKRALRTGHGEFADLPICEFAKSQPSESASKTAHQPMATARDLSESTNQRISESSRIGEVLEGLSIRTDRACKFADLPIRELANESATSRISESATKNHPTDKTIFHLNRRYCNVLAYMALFMCLLAALKAPAQSGAAATLPESADGIVIGDSLPDWFWGVELQVVNHPRHREVIKFEEFKNQLLVLEFWNTACIGCIRALEKWNKLQQAFPEEVAVISIHLYGDNPRAAPFAQKKEWQLPVVLGNAADTAVNRLFYAHRSFGQVWIKNGKLIAVPHEKDVSETLVYRAIENRPLKIEMNDYLTHFDRRLSLDRPINKTEN